MKNILIILAIAIALLSCEKQDEYCWDCTVVEKLYLDNKAYVHDTIITDVVGNFVYCGSLDGLGYKIKSVEKTENIDEYYLSGTVFYWTGKKVTMVDCIKKGE